MVGDAGRRRRLHGDAAHPADDGGAGCLLSAGSASRRLQPQTHPAPGNTRCAAHSFHACPPRDAFYLVSESSPVFQQRHPTGLSLLESSRVPHLPIFRDGHLRVSHKLI